MSTLQSLHKFRQQRLKQEQTIQYDDIDKILLVKRDPITCARYYRHRISAIRKLLFIDNSFFGHVSIYFSIIEFKNRGNEHDHLLIWVKNVPIYGRETNDEIVNFVDTHITCNTEHLQSHLANLHKHHHTRQCKKTSKKNVGTISQFLHFHVQWSWTHCLMRNPWVQQLHLKFFHHWKKNNIISPSHFRCS